MKNIEKYIWLFIGFIVGMASFILINQASINNNPKEVNNTLYQLAYEKEQLMITTDVFDHNNGECDFNCRVKNLQLNGSYSENLYRGNTCSLKYAMELWTKSPEHNKVLDSKYSSGIMLIETRDGTCYITLDVRE